MRQGGTLKGGRQWCRPRARENGLARVEPLPDRVCLLHVPGLDDMREARRRAPASRRVSQDSTGCFNLWARVAPPFVVRRRTSSARALAPHWVSTNAILLRICFLYVLCCPGACCPCDAGQQQMPNTGNMATAMHRIASTGSQEAAGREEVILDRRFQQLVVYVEHNLKQAPETFGEQHLANVVWGAAKLRLQREPLFNLVQREVSLAVSMRCALCRPAWCGFGRQRAAGSGAAARLVPRVLGFVF